MDNKRIEWSSLHDATLDAINVNWQSGTAIVNLAVEIGTHRWAKVVAQDVSDMRCPRRRPWGESVSVNEVKQLVPTTLDIEMQSGDVIHIEAKDFSLELTSDIR